MRLPDRRIELTNWLRQKKKLPTERVSGGEI
jgi:hypothetical protein